MFHVQDLVDGSLSFVRFAGLADITDFSVFGWHGLHGREPVETGAFPHLRARAEGGTPHAADVAFQEQISFLS